MNNNEAQEGTVHIVALHRNPQPLSMLYESMTWSHHAYPFANFGMPYIGFFFPASPRVPIQLACSHSRPRLASVMCLFCTVRTILIRCLAAN